jgi:hypothetical protein
MRGLKTMLSGMLLQTVSNFTKMRFWTTFLLSFIGSIVGFLFGSSLVGLLFVSLMALDLLVGLLRAHKTRTPITSDTMGDKTFRKVMSYLLPLLVLAILGSLSCECVGDWTKTIWLGAQNFLIFWFSLREGLSILEHTDKICNGSCPWIHIMIDIIHKREKAAGDTLRTCLEGTATEKNEINP